MRRRPDLSALAATGPFAGYAQRDLAPLAPHVDRLVVLPGVTLAQQGRHPHEVLVLLAGEVVERRDGIEVGRLGAGAVIGAREELDGAAHAATMVADSPVDALVITGAAFRWAAQSLPGFAVDERAAS
jgi:CRP-like cAMP-binding protein